MQEAPIVHLLAKCLWKQKYIYALERNKRHDLTVWTHGLNAARKTTTMEFKYNFETCSEKLSKELGRLAARLSDKSLANGVKESNWDVMPRIWKDVCAKKPDLFVWIIVSRDLSSLSANDLDKIVNWKPLKKYRRSHPYKADLEFLATVDGFLQILQAVRPFSVSTAEIETTGLFPSTYHFRICEFARA
jgi:hypothetical protein